MTSSFYENDKTNYYAAAEQRARRAGPANCWTGTSGGLAADVINLLKIIRSLSVDKIGERLQNGQAAHASENVFASDYIIAAERELNAIRESIPGDGIQKATPEGINPTSIPFLEALDEVRDMHLRKSKDYGTNADAFANLRSSAEFCAMPSWAGAILRIADKMHRIRAYFENGRTEFDGIEDTLLDGASYFLLALCLYREEQEAAEGKD